MFETNGKFNEEIINELKVYAVSPKKKKFYKIFAIVYGLLGLIAIVIGLIASNQFLIFMFFLLELLAVGGIGLIPYLQYKFKKNNMEALKEISDKSYFEIKTFFNETGAIHQNLTTSTNFEIKYKFFSRLEETPSMYILFTKSGQSVLVLKNCFSDEEKKAFKEFIKEKCKNIK
ncbi:YcxB family protein [Clostridium nigeriense]|uniref:YcxB family protein n=1 Tax=Clostridium nigeriense TaxID=1805470 RepID=UPI003D354165